MIRRITAADLKAWLLDPACSTIVIDVRDADFYGGQITGARNVPSHQFRDRLQEVIEEATGKERIVFHCSLSQQRGPKASKMYEEAVKSRIDRRPTPAIFILDEGFVGWQKHYAGDPRLTTNYDVDHWKYGYSG